jgi:hypothetical protein
MKIVCGERGHDGEQNPKRDSDRNVRQREGRMGQRCHLLADEVERVDARRLVALAQRAVDLRHGHVGEVLVKQELLRVEASAGVPRHLLAPATSRECWGLPTCPRAFACAALTAGTEPCRVCRSPATGWSSAERAARRARQHDRHTMHAWFGGARHSRSTSQRARCPWRGRGRRCGTASASTAPRGPSSAQKHRARCQRWAHARRVGASSAARTSSLSSPSPGCSPSPVGAALESAMSSSVNWSMPATQKQMRI